MINLTSMGKVKVFAIRLGKFNFADFFSFFCRLSSFSTYKNKFCKLLTTVISDYRCALQSVQ